MVKEIYRWAIESECTFFFHTFLRYLVTNYVIFHQGLFVFLFHKSCLSQFQEIAKKALIFLIILNVG